MAATAMAAGTESAPADRRSTPLHTPDGRYIVVRGRLWRAINPALDAETRAAAVTQLMNARRAVGTGLRMADAASVATARQQVDAAKQRLGERGPPWWTDGAPDLNRHMAKNTDYADWYRKHLANIDVDPNEGDDR